MICAVFSGGAYRDPEFYRDFAKDADLIIAADSGGDLLLSLSIVPHILIGDMDSIGGAALRAFRERGAEIVELPPEKDFTDTEMAVRLAVERGAREIILLGAIGSRVDHTLANVSLLIFASERGASVRIVNEDQEAYLLAADVVNPIAGEVGDTVSLISLSDPTTGVTTHDLRYPLTHATLALMSPLGVSNEISGPEPWVEFGEGRLLLIRVRNP
jgi:thiamine pyrophosphokinase